MRWGGRIFITFHKHFDRWRIDWLNNPFSVEVIWSINPCPLQIIIIFCITTFLPCSSSFSGFMIILRFEIYIKNFLLDAKTKRWNYKHWFSFKLFFQLLVLYFLNGKGGKINNKSFWHFSCMNLYLLRNWHTQVVCHQWIWGEKIHVITQVLNRFPWRKQLSRRRRKNNFRHSLRHLQSF